MVEAQIILVYGHWLYDNLFSSHKGTFINE
jgi:hypothetical protein